MLSICWITNALETSEKRSIHRAAESRSLVAPVVVSRFLIPLSIGLLLSFSLPSSGQTVASPPLNLPPWPDFFISEPAELKQALSENIEEILQADSFLSIVGTPKEVDPNFHVFPFIREGCFGNIWVLINRKFTSLERGIKQEKRALVSRCETTGDQLLARWTFVGRKNFSLDSIFEESDFFKFKIPELSDELTEVQLLSPMNSIHFFHFKEVQTIDGKKQDTHTIIYQNIDNIENPRRVTLKWSINVTNRQLWVSLQPDRQNGLTNVARLPHLEIIVSPHHLLSDFWEESYKINGKKTSSKVLAGEAGGLIRQFLIDWIPL